MYIDNVLFDKSTASYHGFVYLTLLYDRSDLSWDLSEIIFKESLSYLMNSVESRLKGIHSTSAAPCRRHKILKNKKCILLNTIYTSACLIFNRAGLGDRSVTSRQETMRQRDNIHIKASVSRLLLYKLGVKMEV